MNVVWRLIFAPRFRGWVVPSLTGLLALSHWGASAIAHGRLAAPAHGRLAATAHEGLPSPLRVVPPDDGQTPSPQSFLPFMPSPCGHTYPKGFLPPLSDSAYAAHAEIVTDGTGVYLSTALGLNIFRKGRDHVPVDTFRLHFYYHPELRGDCSHAPNFPAQTTEDDLRGGRVLFWQEGAAPLAPGWFPLPQSTMGTVREGRAFEAVSNLAIRFFEDGGSEQREPTNPSLDLVPVLAKAGVTGRTTTWVLWEDPREPLDSRKRLRLITRLDPVSLEGALGVCASWESCRFADGSRLLYRLATRTHLTPFSVDIFDPATPRWLEGAFPIGRFQVSYSLQAIPLFTFAPTESQSRMGHFIPLELNLKWNSLAPGSVKENSALVEGGPRRVEESSGSRMKSFQVKVVKSYQAGTQPPQVVWERTVDTVGTESGEAALDLSHLEPGEPQAWRFDGRNNYELNVFLESGPHRVFLGTMIQGLYLKDPPILNMPSFPFAYPRTAVE